MRLIGILSFSQWYFFIIKKSTSLYLAKQNKKEGARVARLIVFVASQHPKILLYHVIKSVIIPSSCWCNACLNWWPSLVLVSFSFLFLSLFSPKNYNLSLLVVGISISVFILLISNFWSWLFCWSYLHF